MRQAVAGHCKQQWKQHEQQWTQQWKQHEQQIKEHWKHHEDHCKQHQEQWKQQWKQHEQQWTQQWKQHEQQLKEHWKRHEDHCKQHQEHWKQQWKQHGQQWKQNWKQQEEHCKQHQEHWKQLWGQWSQGQGHHAPHWRPGCGSRSEDRDKDRDDWIAQPEKVLWVADQLRSVGMLSGSVVAGMAAKLLPKVIAKVAQDPASLGRTLLQQPQSDGEPPFWKALLDLTELTPGLLGRVPPIEVCDEAQVGQAVLAVLLPLSDLPFEQQIAFLEVYFGSQLGYIHRLIQESFTGAALWPDAMVHHGIICDGCQMSPLTGPRFKCQSCDDVDLCGNCFPKKGVVLGGAHADHDFNMWLLGKDAARVLEGMEAAGQAATRAFQHFCGKGGGNGSCKGGPKELGEPSPARAAAPACPEAEAPVPVEDDMTARALAGPGALEAPFESSDLDSISPPAEPSTPTPAVQETTPEPSAPTLAACPVTLGDGSQVAMSWIIGEDPMEVAERFVREHGLPRDEVHVIAAAVAGHR